jgi:hypothetical protein
MMRHMDMKLPWSALLLLLACAACTHSTAGKASNSPTHSAAAPATSVNAQAVCAATYPTVRAAQASRAGDLRFFGPKPLGASSLHFAGLPDDQPVALCIVPSSGAFTVYGVPAGGGRSELLWQQGEADRFARPI